MHDSGGSGDQGAHNMDDELLDLISGMAIDENHDPFDFSTDEAQAALSHFSAMVGAVRLRLESECETLDVRAQTLLQANEALSRTNESLRNANEAMAAESAAARGRYSALQDENAWLLGHSGELERKVRVYESTVGLGVAPVLVRRLIIRLLRKSDSSAE